MPRKPSVHTITVDEILQQAKLPDDAKTRKTLWAALKTFAEEHAEDGVRRLVGRGGHKSRLEWPASADRKLIPALKGVVRATFRLKGSPSMEKDPSLAANVIAAQANVIDPPKEKAATETKPQRPPPSPKILATPFVVDPEARRRSEKWASGAPTVFEQPLDEYLTRALDTSVITAAQVAAADSIDQGALKEMLSTSSTAVLRQLYLMMSHPFTSDMLRTILATMVERRSRGVDEEPARTV